MTINNEALRALKASAEAGPANGYNYKVAALCGHLLNETVDPDFREQCFLELDNLADLQEEVKSVVEALRPPLFYEFSGHVDEHGTLFYHDVDEEGDPPSALVLDRVVYETWDFRGKDVVVQIKEDRGK